MRDTHAAMPGLTEKEAAHRLLAEGYNELPRLAHRSVPRILLDVLREPMLAMLIGAGFIYLMVGDIREASVLIGFASLSIVITLVQEVRTERVLEALRDLTAPRALVIRDGIRRRIAARELVRGDLLLLAEGDRVPADIRIVQCHDLAMDESLLTGESVPVFKRAQEPAVPLPPLLPGGDGQSAAFSGTLIVRGNGLGEVIATGSASEIGKIGMSLVTIDTEAPRLHGQIKWLASRLFVLGLGVTAITVVLQGATRGWHEALLGGIALGMALLPEELPVIVTVFMAMGAWRISRARVLARRATAIETLGAATVLCTDKTGTLTENRMTIAEVRDASGGVWRRGEGESVARELSVDDILRCGILASARHPVDPMEIAFYAIGQDDRAGQNPVLSYGLSADLLAVTNVWRDPVREGFIAAAKGAPEAIIALCRLDEAQSRTVMRQVEAMAGEGMRVLGIARAAFGGPSLPATQRDFDFGFLGLVGLVDPLRKSVPAAIRECRAAGIEVKMITGDFPVTASAIGRQAGLETAEVMTGDMIAALSATELAERVRRTTIFARIRPEQKLRIVEALQANGQIVAMTGDGVNDAPSLKAAHIGIAMGGRGTDVAREASSLVLIDDDFGSIVTAIRLGRRIYDNIRKAVGFVFAVHVPIAGMALAPIALGLPVLFGPIHIALLEIIIDPVCSLAFEAEQEERDTMSRPPRSPDAAIIPPFLALWSLIQGALVLALVATIAFLAFARGAPENEVRTLAYFSLVTCLVGLVLVNRSFSVSIVRAVTRPNMMLVAVLAVLAVVIGLSLAIPEIRAFLRFGPLHADDLAVIAGAGVLLVVVLEALKRIWRPGLLK